MTDWNESSLKAAANWKAFKEGRALFDMGKVAQATTTPEGWTGSVRAGTKLVRLGVKVPRAGLFDVKCSCPENQASGAVCAHAVATGLALLAGGSPGEKPTPAQSPKATAPIPALEGLVPLVVRLAPNWQDTLRRGRLTVVLEPGSNEAIDPVDAFLTAWATQQGIHSIKTATPLALDGDRLNSFLTAAFGHPRVFAGKAPLALESDVTLPLVDPAREGESVELRSDERPVMIDGLAWRMRNDSLARIGPGHAPVALAGALKAWSEGGSFEIPLKQLLRQASQWENWISLPANSWLGDLRMVAATPSFHLELGGALNRLDARLTVGYDGASELQPGEDDERHFPRLNQEGRWETRNLQAEADALQHLRGKGFADQGGGKFSLQGEREILGFLAQGIAELEDWDVNQAPKLRELSSSIEVVRPHMDVVGSGEDWLAFDYSFKTDDGSGVSRAEVLQWLRSGRGVRKSGRRIQILDEEAVLLIEPLVGELDVRQEKGHFIASKAVGEIIREYRKKLHNSDIENDERNKVLVIPATISASVSNMLRPYQRTGVAWLADRVARFGGALLADDMGLGKTLQTIISIESLFSTQGTSGPGLVVAPTSLLGNWCAEYERFAPGRKVHVMHGQGREKRRESIGDDDVIITSYGTLSRDLAWHLRRTYRVIAVDEASLVRNPDTDHAKALAKLRSPHRIALSGTPVENSVRDLWSIFRFIQPGWLGTREQFKERYEMPLQEKPLPKGPLERLRLKTAPFILRRTKEEVAGDLPSKVIIDDYCELSSDQRQVYRDILAEGGKRVDEIRKAAGNGPARMQLLTTLLRLRQTCCDLGLLKNERLDELPVDRRSAKLERLLERVNEAILNDHRVLVFSQFQTQLRKIHEQLSTRQIDAFILDGQTRNRQELIDRFQKEDGPPVFLISLKAGGYGLNLTAADTVVHFDPWWNPAAEMQATDRAHRIGQTKPVTVYRLLTRGTVEEKVVRLQAAKRELAQATFDEEGLGQATGWTDGDLRDLLQG
jgi:superfamily II DNA or RNA helicase